jgi:hypothetical protein
MKHTILFASAGLCLFGFACGGAPNGSSSGTDGAGGPTWYPAQEASDDGEASDPEANIGVVTDDLSFSNWYLQLPTGSGHSPSTISASALSSGTTKSPYFYKASDGSGYIFMDPQHGITTSGSQHPRTEMHESGTWSSSVRIR